MSNDRIEYVEAYNALREVEEYFGYRNKAAIGLCNSRGTFMFRLIAGRVRVKFEPVLRRAKKRRPGERKSPKRRTLIVGKFIVPEWPALSKKTTSLRDLENYLIRYNKKLKKN